MKLKKDKSGRVIGFCGDGATSQLDFHNAMNFAGVFKVPCASSARTTTGRSAS